MGLKGNWQDLIDNESFVQAEDINKIANAEIESEEKIEQVSADFDEFSENSEKETSLIKSDIESLKSSKQDDYKWITIDTFTTEEEAVISKDYSSYKAKGLLAIMTIPENTLTETNRTIQIYFNCGVWCAYNNFSLPDITKKQICRLECISRFGKWDYQAWKNALLYLYHGSTAFDVDSSPINRSIIKNIGTTNSIPAGIQFEVRALVPVNYQE